MNTSTKSIQHARTDDFRSENGSLKRYSKQNIPRTTITENIYLNRSNTYSLISQIVSSNTSIDPVSTSIGIESSTEALYIPNGYKFTSFSAMYISSDLFQVTYTLESTYKKYSEEITTEEYGVYQ